MVLVTCAVHLISLGVLILLADARTKAYRDRRIVKFAPLTAMWEFVPVLSLVPFVPTTLHILPRVFGFFKLNGNSPSLPVASTEKPEGGSGTSATAGHGQ